MLTECGQDYIRHIYKYTVYMYVRTLVYTVSPVTSEKGGAPPGVLHMIQAGVPPPLTKGGRHCWQLIAKGGVCHNVDSAI